MSTERSAGPKQTLGLSDATAIIVGTVIGAGIYETTPLIARSTANLSEIVAVFILGGICAAIGAMCYSELGTVLNRTGGDFVYLNEAYGSRFAFVFAWMTFWVVQPSSVGAIAYIFSRYACELHPALGEAHFSLIAVAVVVLLSVANALGLKVGTAAQKILTGIKVLGLLVLIAAGLFVLADNAAVEAVALDRPATNWELAFILVMYTYGGWNVIVLVAAEVKDAHINLLRSLLLGLSIITVIYILAILAFENTLGHGGLSQSGSAAAEVASRHLGQSGAVFISLLICVTCLANINATILTNSRIFFAFGQRFSTYSWLGRWHERSNSPLNSLIAQGVVAIVLIIALGAGADSFKRLVVFSAPVFWLFFLLVALSLFILRRRNYVCDNAFRVPLYPLTPLIFAGICAFMLYASSAYAATTLGREAGVVALILVLGIVASMFRQQQSALD